MAEISMKLLDKGNTVVVSLDSSGLPEESETAPLSAMYAMTILHLVQTGKMEKLVVDYFKEIGIINEQPTPS